ncbi:MAG: indolepyruvate oxidoreductase subunit beta [Treponema sp.]|nr:indolepyruvate oxidoreductase subunit beta [Treponema sp.]
MMFNCMIAGVGGQGTVLASKLIAAAAMKKGFDVRTTETIGMAQRGGSVFGHVRISLTAGKTDNSIFSPLIPLGKANAIIAFEPAEAVRQLPYLCKDGVVITSNTAIKPVTSLKADSYEAQVMIDFLGKNAPRVIVLDGLRLTEQNAKTLNVSMLGAAVQKNVFPFDAKTLKEALMENLPQPILEMNIRAFETGIEICQ